MGHFLSGILVGLTFAVLLGPAFFALIQTSIQRGFRSGFFLALGIFTSDLIALSLAYFGATQFLGSDPRDNLVFSIVGGIILIIFGTYTFTRKGVKHDEVQENGGKNNIKKPYLYFIKGFVLNGANPGMWFLWITIVVSISAKYGVEHKVQILEFLAGILLTIFSTDILKCFISHRIKHHINANVLTWMNRLVGVILIGIGTYLIMNVLVDLKAIVDWYENFFSPKS
jgi:threonine/homoserine/homoserine lactone efflux protein